MTELRKKVFAGEILQFPPSHASLSLMDRAWHALKRSFGPSPRISARGGPSFLDALAPARAAMFQESGLVFKLLEELGEDPAHYAIDPPRLRGVLPNGHLNPPALPAYTAHRDTWYANPCTQLNFWLALHPITDQDGVCFYPDYFGNPITNSSCEFDYAAWKGFQNTANTSFPAPLMALPLPKAIPLEAGAFLIFSAAQLHQTRPFTSGMIRFSLDFRAICLEDQEGAPDPDNASKGSALVDYLRFSSAS
jgi:hypothetical protein